jgi:beta-glucosidase
VEQIMSRRIASQLSFGRKAVLVSAGLAALAIPITVGMLNVPILGAQTQSPSEPAPQPTPQVNSQPTSPSKFRPPSQVQAQLQQPRTSPEPVWTPSSGAPAGLLTALAGGHHDKFIERARAGNIDLVFFGATDTDMWSWPDSILGGVDRGKRVWDQAFGSLKAANFGSQGTNSESLLWRMQHGELDGYEAKLVVLHGVGVQSSSGGQMIGNNGDQPIGDREAEFVADYARLVAEIRARQPQAKILILAPFPRGRLRREEWRTVADANAVAYRSLADNSTVFYANFGDRFFLPDGSHNQEMWTIPGPPNAGIHEPGFKVWAEELQPWIDRFVR